MKNKKIKLIIIFTLLLSFLLTACSGSDGAEEGITTIDYQKGYSGLEISLVSNRPPDELYESSAFTIAVKLENKGAYDLSNGELSILGFDSNYVYLYESTENFPTSGSALAGRSVDNPNGEVEYLEFEGETLTIKEGAEDYEAKYLVKATYDYSNELVETVCINPDLYDVYDSGCSIEERISFRGQGSPLAISDIEEYVNPGSDSYVEFRITIANEGSGLAKDVTLTRTTLGGVDMDCSFKKAETPNRHVFEDNEQEIELRCISQLSSQSSYETTLFIEYFFGYELSEWKSFNILSGTFS